MRDTLADLVPSEYRDSFYERVPLVDQIIRLKWGYIILNQIHPEEKKRREFAGVHHVSEKSNFDRILFLDKQFGTSVQEEALLDSPLLRGNQISWKTS